MASQSLSSLEEGLEEVRELQRSVPKPPPGQMTGVTLARAIGRASVVLLSSHLEAFIYALNAEAVATVNSAGVESARLPQALRLLHSKSAVDAISATSWENNARAGQLESYNVSDAWLWSNGVGTLEGDRLLVWMKSPGPKNLKRYFAYWGIDDVFGRIARRPAIRIELWRRLNELVDKRNAIAHGDLGTAVTPDDVRLYLKAVQTLGERVDRALSAQLSRLCGVARPW